MARTNNHSAARLLEHRDYNSFNHIFKLNGFDMGTLIMAVVLGAIFGSFFLTFHKLTSNRSGSSPSGPDCIQIDEKNFILNGEHISFETDTPLLRFQQERADNEQYRHYERQKLQNDRRWVGNEFLKTLGAINKHPELWDEITDEDSEKFKEKYATYSKMCDKLKKTLKN